MLVSSQTAVKGEHGFEIASRVDNLCGGDWREIQNSAHRVRSMHSRSSLFAVVFVFDIANTEIHSWREYNKYQGMKEVKIWWDFGLMNLYFLTICSAGGLFNSDGLGFDFLLWRNNAWQRILVKRLLIPVLHMFACLVSIHSEMWIRQQTSCLH